MDLIAKRKVAETWRDAVSARAAARDESGACLAGFDALVADGTGEAEAAYRALRGSDLLWPLDAGTDPATAPSDPGDPGDPHEVPSV